jgi:hypothetical protein
MASFSEASRARSHRASGERNRRIAAAAAFAALVIACVVLLGVLR